MRSVTTPFFPAQIAGAVTLQAVIDAREGDRLPLDMALYVAGELGRQVSQLHALGREGSLDPSRVWCTSKGAVVVQEAAAGEARALGPLVYKLLSGSGDVSAWPPSYFNPSVAESIDEAVMSVVNGHDPESTRAMVEALTVAAGGLDQEESISGMARLVYAVSDEPAPRVVVAPRPSVPSLPSAPIVGRRPSPRRIALIAVACLVFLAGAIGLAVWGPAKANGEVAVAPVAAPVAAQPVVAAKAAPQKSVKAPGSKAPSARKGLSKTK